jgi:hypothetical protein
MKELLTVELYISSSTITLMFTLSLFYIINHLKSDPRTCIEYDLILLFCTTMISFHLERNSTFLRSKYYELIPFLWNVLLQNSFENPLIQTNPYFFSPSLLCLWIKKVKIIWLIGCVKFEFKQKFIRGET